MRVTRVDGDAEHDDAEALFEEFAPSGRAAGDFGEAAGEGGEDGIGQAHADADEKRA